MAQSSGRGNDSFLKWLTAKVDEGMITRHERILLYSRGDLHGLFLSLADAESLPQDTALVKIRYNSCLDRNTATNLGDLEHILQDTANENLTPDIENTLVFLSEKSIGNLSPFYGWLQSLEEIDVPITWPQHKKDAFRGTDAEGYFKNDALVCPYCVTV
jgi:hypothetical protein